MALTRPDAPSRNRLLAALGTAELAEFEPYLTRADLARGQVLHPAGEPIEQIWFPEAGVASVRVTLAGGDAVEVGTVGCEGFIGHAVLLGDTTSIAEALMQVPGVALSLPVAAFQAALEHDATFGHLLCSPSLMIDSPLSACLRLALVVEQHTQSIRTRQMTQCGW